MRLVMSDEEGGVFKNAVADDKIELLAENDVLEGCAKDLDGLQIARTLARDQGASRASFKSQNGPGTLTEKTRDRPASGPHFKDLGRRRNIQGLIRQDAFARKMIERWPIPDMCLQLA